MPIVSFNNHTDVLPPKLRSRDHFITNIDLEDDRYDVGTVHGYTMRGHWRYLEHDWIAKPGTYIYEPAGEAHTLVITEDSPEPMITLFVVEGGFIYLDKTVNGSFAAYEDGFTALDLTRKHYRGAGLDVKKLDALIR